MKTSSLHRKCQFAIGWHIIDEGRVLRNERDRKKRIDVVGEKKRMAQSGKPVVCRQGMHASPTIGQAMSFNSRSKSLLRCVLVEKDVTQYRFDLDDLKLKTIDRSDHFIEKEDDKFAGTYRTPLFEIKLSTFLQRVKKLAAKQHISSEKAFRVVERDLIEQYLLLDLTAEE